MTATNTCYNFVGFRYRPPLNSSDLSGTELSWTNCLLQISFCGQEHSFERIPLAVSQIPIDQTSGHLSRASSNPHRKNNFFQKGAITGETFGNLKFFFYYFFYIAQTLTANVWYTQTIFPPHFHYQDRQIYS